MDHGIEECGVRAGGTCGVQRPGLGFDPAFVADDCVFVDGRGAEHKGPDAFVNDYAKGWPDAFSDAEVTEAKYHDAGDTVVAEFVGTGTNDGPIGPMPATNRRIELPYCEIYHFGPDGKIIGGHAYFDMYGMLVQLGHAEPPADS